MKRCTLTLETVANWKNLTAAYRRAARGKRQNLRVKQFSAHFESRLAELRKAILDSSYVPKPYRCFQINDPKPRTIHAPHFADRVVHHALMYHAGPEIDRYLVDDTFACRTGKGTLAAVQRCQQHVQRFEWYAKIDMRSYFTSIDHYRLNRMLCRRFKNKQIQQLFARIIDSYHADSGKGLPIGALSSQYFANFYLSSLDRYLLEELGVQGMVRYMDDVIWFDRDKQRIQAQLKQVREFVCNGLALTIKSNEQINRSSRGLTACGCRITRQGLRLTARKRHRYIQNRTKWEQAYVKGLIDEVALQQGFAATYSMVAHADSLGWRQAQLRRNPVSSELEGVC